MEPREGCASTATATTTVDLYSIFVVLAAHVHFVHCAEHPSAMRISSIRPSSPLLPHAVASYTLFFCILYCDLDNPHSAPRPTSMSPNSRPYVRSFPGCIVAVFGIMLSRKMSHSRSNGNRFGRRTNEQNTRASRTEKKVTIFIYFINA